MSADAVLNIVRTVAPDAGYFHPSGAEITHADGILVVTDDGPWGYVLGIYDAEAWADSDSGTLIDGLTADDVIRIIGYLLTNQPEAVSWAAWAAQRIADDGCEVGR